MLLHALQELDDDLARGTDEHLTFAALFGVGDRLQTIGEDGHAHHFCVCVEATSLEREE